MEKEKKSKIEVGIKGEPGSFRIVNAQKAKGNLEYYQGNPKKVEEMEKKVKPGMLINRNHHPVTLSYDGEALILPPRGKEMICNVDKLGGLAPNVVFVPEK